MGYEAWLYAMIDVAGAEEVLQYGFDETMIDRQSTMNQWTLIREGGELRVVTIEAGGIMVGGTAQEVSAHTKETWRRGQVGVDMVRQELIKIGGVALADRLVPIRGGGVRIHKIRSIMSDAVPPSPPPSHMHLSHPPLAKPLAISFVLTFFYALAVQHRQEITKGNRPCP